MFFTPLSHSLSWEHLTRLLVNRHIQRAARQAGKVLRRAAEQLMEEISLTDEARSSLSPCLAPHCLQKGGSDSGKRGMSLGYINEMPWTQSACCLGGGAVWAEWDYRGRRLAFLKIWPYLGLNQCSGVFGGTSVTCLASKRWFRIQATGEPCSSPYCRRTALSSGDIVGSETKWLSSILIFIWTDMLSHTVPFLFSLIKLH